MTQQPLPDVLNLAPRPAAVTEALNWLGVIAAREGWNEAARHRMALSLDEALNNVLSHAFRDRPSGAETPAIRLECRSDIQAIALEIIDNGPPFDPTQAASAPPLDDLETAYMGGHGLRLMRHYLDDIVYERRDETNRLRLVCSRNPTAD